MRNKGGITSKTYQGRQRENGMFDTIGNFFRCVTNHSKVNARWDDDDNRSKVLQQTTLKEYEFPFL